MSTSQPIGIIVEFLEFTIAVGHVLFSLFGFDSFRLLFGFGVSPLATFLPLAQFLRLHRAMQHQFPFRL